MRCQVKFFLMWKADVWEKTFQKLEKYIKNVNSAGKIKLENICFLNLEMFWPGV